MEKRSLILMNIPVLQFKKSNVLVEYQNKRLPIEINIL